MSGRAILIRYNGTAMHECCKWLVKRLYENIRILQQFKINELYLVRKLNFHGHDFFRVSSGIINEFH